MNYNYRLLTEEEIRTLESNGCRAENWATVSVAEDFRPQHIHGARFYGNIRLGVFEKEIKTGEGFCRHSGIYNATLRNVTVGSNSLIENIGNHINNYEIGEECHICNTGTIETTEGATFGSGNIISVLNEAGRGNVMISDRLTSNIAALTVRNAGDRELLEAVTEMTARHIKANRPECGKTGNRVRIMNTTEITNTLISDSSEICGAYRLHECSVAGNGRASVYIGSGVTCEGSVICGGSSVINGATLENCFVGEACCIKNNFSAENSVFFANTYMSNGEACAAFCGPFTASHHKNSLLIGGMFSFYNAGSATNFSNHAYKMGPVHHGTLERGTKTASGAHILMPAHIGAFSVCMGKISCHPDTSDLPFSYIISDGRKTYIVPARNLTTAGFYRDIHKWERRDMRPHGGRASIVNFDWLSPLTAASMIRGKSLLERLAGICGDGTSECQYGGCTIKATALKRGIALYDMALRMFIGYAVKDSLPAEKEYRHIPHEWCDLSGLIIPAEEEKALIENLKDGSIASIDELQRCLEDMHGRYGEYRRDYARQTAKTCYGLDASDSGDRLAIEKTCHDATETWLREIRKDAEKEYAMGDVEREVLDSFLKDIEIY